jgi:hypothetical protein
VATTYGGMVIGAAVCSGKGQDAWDDFGCILGGAGLGALVGVVTATTLDAVFLTKPLEPPPRKNASFASSITVGAVPRPGGLTLAFGARL